MFLRRGIQTVGAIPLGMGEGAAPGAAEGPYEDKVLDYGPIAYWMLAEPAGAVALCEVNAAQNGTYYGATLGQPALVPGYTSVYFPGGDPGPAESSCDIYSLALDAVFDGNTGTVAGWFRWDGDVIDGNPQRLIWMRAVPAGTYLNIGIDGVDGLHSYVNPTLSFQFIIDAAPDLLRHHVAMTWDLVAGGVAYLDGVPVDTDVGNAPWAGALRPASCVLASDYVDGDSFANFTGWMAHWALWDSVLGPAAILDLATV